MDLVTLVGLSLLPGRDRFTAVATIRSLLPLPSLPGEECRLHRATAEDIDAALERSGLAGRARERRTEAEQALDRAARRGVRVCTFIDDAYPALLAAIPDPPAVLWTRGDPGTLAQPMVAVVGTRAASRTAVSFTRDLARDLASAGLVVASGLARGIDASAHEGALEERGTTVAVVGTGVDVVYPAEHDALAARIERAGVVVSEFPPGTAPRPHHFPLRNRLLSGLSRATLVIEAPATSGALITAKYALDHGRDVLAVPGAVAGGRNAGGHALLRDGARLIESAADVLDHLGWAPRAAACSQEWPDDPVLEALASGEALALDDIVLSTGLAAGSLLARLTTLEIAGLVARGPGGWFVTTRPKVVVR